MSEIYKPQHPQRARDIYRIRTGMAAGEKILEENIERWVVEHLAVYFNVSVDRVKQWLLEDDEK